MSEMIHVGELPDKDREIAKKIIRKLLSETNIVRDKDEVSRMYYLFAKRSVNLEAINDYLSVIRFMAVVDDSGYIRLAESEASAISLKTGHARLEKDVSQVLLALAWIYFEKENQFTRNEIIIPVGELNIALEKFHFEKIIDSIKRADYIFKRLASFNLIKVVGKPGTVDCKICIYPSVKMSLSPTKIEAYVAKFNTDKSTANEVTEDEDTASEYEDEDPSEWESESSDVIEGQISVEECMEEEKNE
jgi:hypothetical protein